MFTLIFSFLAGIAVYSLTFLLLRWSVIWCVAMAFLAMFLTQLVISLLVKRAAGKVNAVLQGIMGEIQQKLQQKQNQLIRKPIGNQKTMMQILEKEQNAGLEKLMEALELFTPLFKWNFFLKRQISSMRAIFLFQQKKFDEVDALLPKAFYFDPQLISIRLARLYKNEAPDSEIDLFFRKKCRKLRGEKGVIPNALYSWILVKRNRIDDAIKLLNVAKESCDSEVLSHNWEMLVNGKTKQFSNANLGEQWYALYLEEPKLQRVQQNPRFR